MVVAGCGRSVPSGPDLTSFAAAADASAGTDTGRFELKLEQSLPGTDKTFGFSASGGFDTPNERAQLTFDMSALAQLLTGLGGGFGGKVGGDLSNDPDDWKLEAIRDGDIVYVHFPLLAQKLPGGKPWIKADVKELIGDGGSALGQFGSFAGADPRDTFSYLKAVAGAIETVGVETVRDAETTHYRATIDVAKLMELVTSEHGGSIAGFDGMLEQAGFEEIPVDVWLDAEQRVRKLEMELDLGAPGSGETSHTALTIEVFGYGEPLDISLPPADQVVDAATLEKLGS
jgi:hypothetical protein